jgi:N-acetylneuraminic acid mutarotase
MQPIKHGLTKNIAFSGLSVIIWLLGSATISTAQEPWAAKASMPMATSPRAASVVDKKIYAFGGSTNKPPYPGLSIVQMYDPATDTWDTTKTPMPTPRSGASAVTVNGKIFVIGGRGSQSGPSYSVVEVYDPATDTWDTTKSPMLTAKWWHSACVVNGRIYVIGGERYFHGGILDIVEEYDPTTNIWIAKNPMPTARWALSTSVVNGKIYAFGGCRSSGSPYPGLSTVEEYDPVTDTWTTKTDMPNAMFWMSTSTVDDRIFAIGGFGSQNGPTYRSVEAYDPVTDTWTAHTKMPTARFNISTNVVNGKIYVIGGIPCSGCSPINTTEVYDPFRDLAGLIKEFNINQSFAIPGSDTVWFSATVTDPAGITLMAELVTTDRTPVDSLQLFDDGNHQDGHAGDSLYANAWPVSSTEEQQYYVDLHVTRIDTETIIQYMENLSTFTTIGPVVFDSMTFKGSDTVAVPGGTHSIYITLRNTGSTVKVTDLAVGLISLDSLLTVPEYVRTLGNIAPGEEATTSSYFRIEVSENCPKSCELPILIQITSNDQLFWTDTCYVHVGSLTGIQASKQSNPNRFALSNIYPNPFNPETTIAYAVKEPCEVRLIVTNVLGQTVKEPIHSFHQPGEYTVHVHMQDNPSGLYFYHIVMGDFQAVKKMVKIE